MRRWGTRSLALALAFVTVSACAGPSVADLVGLWRASDGSTKTVADDGTCVGMYYLNGQPLDIGGLATCTMSQSASDGLYTLVVEQPPNRQELRLQFDGNDQVTVYENGMVVDTLTRE